MFEKLQTTLTNLKPTWDKIQSLADIDGDVWMGAFTAAIIFRVVYAAFGKAPLTAAEAAAYGSAIGAFAYSNKGPKV